MVNKGTTETEMSRITSEEQEQQEGMGEASAVQDEPQLVEVEVGDALEEEAKRMR